MATSESYKSIIKKLDQLPLINQPADRVGMMQEILQWMGHPEARLRIIHIVGTNGKGSTGTMLANVLIENDYKVGHFSTPAVIDQREVITINNQNISETEFLETFLEILTEVKRHGGAFDTLTKFEWLTLMALVYFDQKDLDFVILEANFGGAQDATNAITNPFMVIFTKISTDHLGRLGKNLHEIAEIKAATIKKDALVISYPGQDLEVEKVLREKTVAVGAIWNDQPKPQITVLNSSPKGIHLNVNQMHELYLSLTGNYQANNLSTVIAALNMLETHGFAIEKDKAAQGLAYVKIKGRMEYDVDRNILFDGAHNPEGIRGLVASLRSWHLPFKPTVILGLMDNNHVHEILEELLPQVATLIAVTPDNERGLSADALAAQAVLMSNVDVEIADDPSAAIQLARRMRESSRSLIVVTGSFYTLRAILSEDNF